MNDPIIDTEQWYRFHLEFAIMNADGVLKRDRSTQIVAVNLDVVVLPETYEATLIGPLIACPLKLSLQTIKFAEAYMPIVLQSTNDDGR